jgi:hypothetical protein
LATRKYADACGLAGTRLPSNAQLSTVVFGAEGRRPFVAQADARSAGRCFGPPRLGSHLRHS